LITKHGVGLTLCRRLAAVHVDMMNSSSETSIDRPSPAIRM